MRRLIRFAGAVAFAAALSACATSHYAELCDTPNCETPGVVVEIE